MVQEAEQAGGGGGARGPHQIQVCPRRTFPRPVCIHPPTCQHLFQTLYPKIQDSRSETRTGSQERLMFALSIIETKHEIRVVINLG